MHETMAKDNKSRFKDIHLFNRQFLGIGTSDMTAKLYLKQARRWEENCQSKYNNKSLERHNSKPPNKRKLKIGYLIF